MHQRIDPGSARGGNPGIAASIESAGASQDQIDMDTFQSYLKHDVA